MRLARARCFLLALSLSLQLVEHLRPSRRARLPPRGDHQPPAGPDGDRQPHEASRRTTIRVTSSHAKAEPAARALAAVAAFLRGLAKNAEQLTDLQKWREILSCAFQAFLDGRFLRARPASRQADAA
jgi:hypothetical protein